MNHRESQLLLKMWPIQSKQIINLYDSCKKRVCAMWAIIRMKALGAIIRHLYWTCVYLHITTLPIRQKLLTSNATYTDPNFIEPKQKKRMMQTNRSACCCFSFPLQDNIDLMNELANELINLLERQFKWMKRIFSLFAFFPLHSSESINYSL